MVFQRLRRESLDKSQFFEIPNKHQLSTSASIKTLFLKNSFKTSKCIICKSRKNFLSNCCACIYRIWRLRPTQSIKQQQQQKKTVLPCNYTLYLCNILHTASTALKKINFIFIRIYLEKNMHKYLSPHLTFNINGASVKYIYT